MGIMAAPLHEAKADLFRALAHPVRIRVLELLSHRPMQVRELLAEIPIEPSSLSQQLAVLRRAGVVTSSRTGSAVVYAVNTPAVSELLAAGRKIMAHVWSDAQGLLHELRESS